MTSFRFFRALGLVNMIETGPIVVVFVCDLRGRGIRSVLVEVLSRAIIFSESGSSFKWVASAGRDHNDCEEVLKKPADEWDRTEPTPNLCDTLGASDDALGVATVE